MWQLELVICIAATTRTGGLASGLPSTAGIIDISDIIHSSDHEKSSCISQLINAKSNDLQKLLKYSNFLTEQQLLQLIYYYNQMCSLLILSYIQKMYLLFSIVIYPVINIFIFIIIYFISKIIPQTP